MALDRRRARSAAAGFTLLEVLIALAVVAIAFTTLLGWHAHSIRTTIYNQNLGRATLLARERASLVQFQVLKDGLQNLGNESGRIDGYPAFSYEQQVFPTGIDEMRQVVLRVIWDQRNPNACEVTFFVRDPAL